VILAKGRAGSHKSARRFRPHGNAPYLCAIDYKFESLPCPFLLRHLGVGLIWVGYKYCQRPLSAASLSDE
jgi:hypothetical protein